MSNEFLINRETYKKIKSFDRAQMELFLKGVMKDAADNPGIAIDKDALRSEIGAIKGVGESRLNEIMAVIDKYLPSFEEEK